MTIFPTSVGLRVLVVLFLPQVHLSPCLNWERILVIKKGGAGPDSLSAPFHLGSPGGV